MFNKINNFCITFCFSINNAIFKGRYNGIITSIGHGIGIAVYATFAVLGLGLIIKTNIFIFNSLKILSIIFLIFIGVKSILNKEKLNLEKKDIKENIKENIIRIFILIIYIQF